MAVMALIPNRSEPTGGALPLLFGFVSVTKLLLTWLFGRMAAVCSLPALVAIGFIQTEIEFT